MLISHKIELTPNMEQTIFFSKCSGTARFAYNWALAEWRRLYASGEKVNEAGLRKQLNSIKKDMYPWMLEVPKSVVQQSIKNLGDAFTNFFRRAKSGKCKKKELGYPKFKSKRGKRNTGFRIDNGEVVIDYKNQSLYVPKLGYVKMRELPRYEGQIFKAIISKQADRWYVSLGIKTDCQPAVSESQAFVGVDLGVNTLAQLSTGESFIAPKPYKFYLKKLKRAQRRLSKAKLGSSNRDKRRLAVAKLHKRIANIRNDYLHKLTTYLAKKFLVISIEDLNVKGMLASDRLSRAIADLGFYEFRRQLEYKTIKFGSKLVLVDRWFPSSKTCSRCGCVKSDLGRGDRTYVCSECGFTLDRDLNASFNMLLKGLLAYEVNYLPQALREVTLRDTLALLEEVIPQATSVVELRRETTQFTELARIV